MINKEDEIEILNGVSFTVKELVFMSVLIMTLLFFCYRAFIIYLNILVYFFAS